MSYGSHPHDSRSASATRSDFVGGLSDSIRQNPVPAALVGIGILWLFTGGRHVMLGGAASSAAGGLGRAAQDAGGAAYRGVRDTTGRVVETLGGAAESAGRMGVHAAEAVRSAADAMQSVVSRGGEAVRDAASNATDQIWSESDDMSRRGGSAVPGPSFGGTMERAQSTLADLFERQPLVLGAVGIAIGAALAASLPPSDAENRIMGDTADTVKDRASELWAETKKRGADLASTGLEEAEARGLTPEAAGTAARTIASKVVGLAEKTGKDIIEKTRG